MRLHPSWIAVVALLLVSGCEARPALAVPPGPPRAVAVDVQLPVYVAGRWAVHAFTDSLRIELAKYRIAIVETTVEPMCLFHIDLGEFTYRQWQEIDVTSSTATGATPIGKVHLLDLDTSTVEAAAEPVAVIIARQVWGMASPEPTDPSCGSAEPAGVGP